MKNRLPDFWTSWTQQLALKKENASTTASLTVSRASSAKTVPIDNAATDGEEQYEDANKQPYQSDTDTATDGEPGVRFPANVAKKDVLVLLSSIINTVALSGRKFSISKKISQGSRLPRLDTNSADYQSIKALLEDLLKTLHPATPNTSSKNNRSKPQLRSLKRRVWTLLSKAEEETAKGELVSKASTQARQKAESKYGSTSSTACGRKVDMLIRIRFDDKWQHEVAIFEFKATTATRAVREKQQKKSVRFNAAILYDLEANGLDISKSYPIIAEGQALSLDFYALRRYDEVLGAGRSSTKGISLPSHVDQLKAFFESETIFILWLSK
ncbi:hypothetical protein BGX33_008801 [Mortierella sp. NVP41]|nr:hypothetical protein BGX33_008801 [Mortierella sp. NVP41]